MIKKRYAVTILALLFSSFLINLVSAYSFYYNPRQGMNDLINIVVDFSEPLLQALLGGGTWDGYLLFEKLVLFILIAAVVYVSIEKTSIFEHSKPALWIVTLAIPLLGVRWMNFEWLNYILLQYALVSVVLTVILPFIIYLYFIHKVSHSSAFRRIAWIFYILVYLGLWSTSPAGLIETAYLWSIFLAVAFMLFDSIIHKMMTKDEDLAPLRASLTNSIAELDRQLDLLNSASHLGVAQKEKSKKHIEKKIYKLQKELARL